MRPAPFAYLRPSTLDEVLELAAQHGDDAKILAGGQSLLPLMRLRLSTPQLLIDITGVPGLQAIQAGDGELKIGALARHRQVEIMSTGPQWRILPLAARQVAHLPIRVRGTFGGSIAHADPAAEFPLLVQTLGGRVRLQRKGGSRVVAASDFFQSYLTTAAEPDEVLTEVSLPEPPSGARSAFVEFARRQGDFAVAAAAAVVDVDPDGVCAWCRIGLAGVAETPLRLTGLEQILSGRRLTDTVIDDAVREGTRDLTPGSDIHGSAEYRKQVSAVLLQRALRRVLSAEGAGRRQSEGS